MAKSIIQSEERCFMCGSFRWLECHHIFGASNRKKSEYYGLKVLLCHYCHNEPPNGVHQNRKNRLMLQKLAQEKAMQHYGWTKEQFREIFGKNYID